MIEVGRLDEKICRISHSPLEESHVNSECSRGKSDEFFHYNYCDGL